MNYYIADTHFGHKGILDLDKRPWDNIQDMQTDMTARWNARVTDNDDVYILGDFCLNKSDWIELLTSLNGRKHLIIGNHDLKKFPDNVLELLAEPPQRLMGIEDSGYSVILCHYPLLTYWHSENPSVVMLYGHVHQTPEDDAVRAGINATKEHLKKTCPSYEYQGNLHNVWCGYYDYAPATLEEISKNPF